MKCRRKDWRSRLERLVVDTRTHTGKKHDEVKDKRARRAERRIVERDSLPIFSVRGTPFKRMSVSEAADSGKKKSSQTNIDSVNWYHVQEWFIHGIIRNNRDWLVVRHEDKDSETQTMWVWAEKNCAERLLGHYGADVLKRTVDWFCDNWQGLKDESGGRLTGAPSVKLLWASREMLFSDAKEGRIPGLRKRSKLRAEKRHMVGEYEESNMPRVGWGDEDEL